MAAAVLVSGSSPVRPTGQPSGTQLDVLCERCVRALGVSGAGVVLIIDGLPQGTLGASNARVRMIEDLQFTFGEGPCLDAHNQDRLVAVADLSGAASRWPAYAPGALDAGVAAVFAFPLRIGAARFGALDLYRDQPGPLAPADVARAALIADAATMLLIATQAAVPDGELADVFAGVVEQRSVVYQASGMVAVQLGLSAEDALVALRARAYQLGISVHELADVVVGLRIRLDEL